MSSFPHRIINITIIIRIPCFWFVRQKSMKSSKQARSWQAHGGMEEKSLFFPVNRFGISLLTSSDLRKTGIVLMLKNKMK